MKIARIETFLVAPRWLFVRVETDDGIVGWGEPVVEGRARTVATAVEELAGMLIGQDSGAIEHLWQLGTRGTFYRGGPVLSSAVAGIDQALWDIKGKRLGVPVWDLLGGPTREFARVYSWIGGDSPEGVADHALEQQAAGFTAVKMNASAQVEAIDTPATVRSIVARAEAVREACGDQFDFALDFHGRISPAMARRLLPLLEPLLPLFVEEPVTPELSREIGSIVDSTSIPIATGERLYNRWDFAPVLAAGVAVAQPDLSHAGGISEVRRIAAHAELHGASIAPHCPLGPLSLASSLQIAFSTPNFLIQEQSLGIHYNVGNDILDYLVDPEPFRFVNGTVKRPTGPGLGVTIDENVVRAADRRGHEWTTPTWSHRDGGFAEW